MIKKISNWLGEYIINSELNGFVVGVSGGVDSAVTSALCAETGLPVLAVSMPIHQDVTLHSRSELQLDWLTKKYNIETSINDLSSLYDVFIQYVDSNDLGFANSKARLRMTTLYALASHRNGLVVGTGNKVEDFGVGFFTKYGDGGVDISPIADLMKSEVYVLAKELDIPKEIQEAAPTDGLWEDGRTDENQLGVTYVELEWAMNYVEEVGGLSNMKLNERQCEILEVYRKFNLKNKHKMNPIPVFKRG